MTRRPNIRWQLLLALVCLGLVLSLLSFQVQTAGLCTTRVPAVGGSLIEGVVGAPRYLNPLLSDPNPVDREIASLVFDGLTRYDDSGQLVPALARSWKVSEDGREVAFSLRQDVVWHDGQPFSAEDVVFTFGLLQEDGFPAPDALRSLWQSIAIDSAGPYSVTFTVPEPYSPFLEATTRGILPAHRFQGLSPQRIAESEFNLRPVGTGPFMVPDGENWRRTGRLHLAPYPARWSEGVSLDNVELRFFPDFASLLRAYEAGEVHAINRVPVTDFPAVAALTDARLYTAPLPRYTQLLFNLSNQGPLPLGQRQVREALAYALDRPALIDQALNGQGIPLEGPFLPSSWAYNPQALTPRAYQPLTATQLLEEAGWTVAEGDSVRQREGESLVLELLLLDAPVQRAVAAAIAEQWAAVGVQIQLNPASREALNSSLAERNFDVALTPVAASGDPDLYDFWSQPAIVNGHNFSGWSSRRASEALEHARQSWDIAERKAYYDAFLDAFGSAVPAISLYQDVTTYVVSDEVKEVDIGRVDDPRERYADMADWFLLYRDVTVRCSEPTPESPAAGIN